MAHRLPSPDERAERLAARRALKMARSAHAFVRGSTAAFYEWLASPSGARLPHGPPIWICGDCHVGNLGPVGRTVGDAVIELRDLDQTTVGNPAFDVVRLGLSLAMAARGSDLPGVTTARIAEELVDGYGRAFAGEVPSEAVPALPKPLRVVMKRALERTWKRLVDERVGGGRQAFPLGKRFWPLADEEREALGELVAREDVRRLVTRLESRDDDAEIVLVDAAYWVKGCSSLGLWRGAVLVEVRAAGGRGPRQLSLLDVKEATDTVAPTAKGAVPAHAGERVVAGARRIAPALGERMAAATLLGRPVFVRELLPQDLKCELDRVTDDEARTVAHHLGMVVGRAHARQLDDAARRAWLAEMTSHRPRGLDAPGWLWTALVELVGTHERAYLEHCRRYALAAERERTG